MKNIVFDSTMTDNDKNWCYIGQQLWKQDQTGVILPPVWADPKFDDGISPVPDYYAHDLTREDYAFYIGQRLGDTDISVDYSCAYGAILHGSIVFRADSSLCCYVLDIEDMLSKAQSYRFRLYVQDEMGYRRELAVKTAPHSIVPGRLAYGRIRTRDDWNSSFTDWARIRVQASGPYIRVAMDGNIIFDMQDSTYLSGYAGLAARGAVMFRDLRIEGMPDDDNSKPWNVHEGLMPRFFYPGGKQPEGFNAYPVICRTDSGTTIVAWFHGDNTSDGWSNSIVFTVSKDEGLTWSLPKKIYSSGKTRVIPSSVYAHKNGDISLLAGDTDTGDSRYFVFRMKNGSDGWDGPAEFKTAPFRHTGNVYFFSPMKRLMDGTVVMTGYEHQAVRKSKENDFDYRSRSILFRSNDDGYTWDEAYYLTDTVNDHNEFVTAEVCGDKLIACIRSQKASGMSYTASCDGGKTWSPYIHIDAGGDHPHIIRHSSGALAMTCRSFGYFMWFSFDDGKTWSPLWRISPASGVGAMTEMADGRILLVVHEGYKDPGHIRGQYFNITPEGPAAV
jgi:hypothetical protein